VRPAARRVFAGLPLAHAVLLAHREGAAIPAFTPRRGCRPRPESARVRAALPVLAVARQPLGVRRLPARGDRSSRRRTASRLAGGLGPIAVAT
jgi:hypothetical protein